MAGRRISVNKPLDAIGPVADYGEAGFVGGLVAQGVEEFQGGIEGAMLGRWVK
jgi:hypothetical protein